MKLLIAALSFFVLAIAFLVRPVSALATASLSLSPASATQTVGSTFNVDIILDTGGDSISGASALITYDNTRLSVVGSTVTPGNIFGSATTPLTNTVNASYSSGLGQIQYDSGSLGTPYVGHGTLATITFKALSAGAAQVNFVFNSGATSGTSIVALSSSPTNDLGSVNNGNYTITAGSSGTSLPATGALEDTLVMLGGGVIFLLGGLILWRRNQCEVI